MTKRKLTYEEYKSLKQQICLIDYQLNKISFMTEDEIKQLEFKKFHQDTKQEFENRIHNDLKLCKYLHRKYQDSKNITDEELFFMSDEEFEHRIGRFQRKKYVSFEEQIKELTTFMNEEEEGL